jgi:putative transposase
MIAFIDDHREAHGVEPLCKVLPIAPSTYHEHAAKRADLAKLSPRAKRDVALKAESRRVFAENFEAYGVRKVWRQLRREGIGAQIRAGNYGEIRVGSIGSVSPLFG